MENEEKSIADGLRELADWYEKHPEITCPVVHINIVSLTANDKVSELGTIAKAFGTCKKTVNNWSFSINRDFGPVRAYAHVGREEVCKRVIKWECPESLLAAIGKDAMKAFEEA